jgi:hypothetical protein
MHVNLTTRGDQVPLIELLSPEFLRTEGQLLEEDRETVVREGVPVAGTSYYYQKSGGQHEHRATSM